MTNEIGKKGISLYVSHVLATAILMVALGIVATSAYSYYSTTSLQLQRAEANAVMQPIAEAAIDLYTTYRESPAAPSSGANITLGEVVIDVPAKVAGKNYELNLTNRDEYWITAGVTRNDTNTTVVSNERLYGKVTLKTDGQPSASFDYVVYNIPVETFGRASRVNHVKLAYVRFSENGVLVDKIFLSGAA